MATTAVTVAEALTGASVAGPVLRSPVSAADMATFAGSLTRSGKLKASASDRVKVASSAALSQRLTVALSSGLVMRGSLRSGLYGRLAERLAIGGVLTGRQQIILREVVRLLGRGSPAAARVALLRSGLRLADTLNHARGAALLDDLRLSPRTTAAYKAMTSMIDRVEMTASLGYQLIATVLVDDGFDFVDGTLLHALFHGHLRDRMDFILDVVDPSGDVTCWAMNARTNAITEYLNYGFNAFAQSSQGPYLAAGDDGLYELTGPDDAGAPVIADVVSGLADFSGIFLSGIQAAYLGIRGSGEFFLKLTAATGQSTTYAVKATSMRTARVNMGKGWRARYMTWELLSTGQDFDLLDVTFLPIQQTRRI